MLRSIINRLKGPSSNDNQNIKWAVEFVTSRNVEGDYFEFGVYDGSSFGYAMTRLDAARRSRRVLHQQNGLPVPSEIAEDARYFAFDSFAGLPAPTGPDTDARLPSFWQQGMYKCSVEDFKRNLARQQVDLSRVVLVEGWYDQTLTPQTKQDRGIRKGSIFHIDCDLYESTILALEFITELYVDGSVLIFDDWFGFKGNPRFGEQRAFREWSERHGVASSEFWRHQGRSVAFILHKD